MCGEFNFQVYSQKKTKSDKRNGHASGWWQQKVNKYAKKNTVYGLDI